MDKPRAGRGGKAKFVALGLATVALLGAGAAYAMGLGKETTDDAQIEGHLQNVSARVSGVIMKVDVKDNQAVKTGEVLAELDRVEFEVRVEASNADVQAAEAAVAAADATLEATERNTAALLTQANGGLHQAHSAFAAGQAQSAQARADVAAADARYHLAQVEYDRVTRLVAAHSLSEQQLDTARSALKEAEAALAHMRARSDADGAQLVGYQGGIEAARGRLAAAETGPQQVASARAAVELARARLEQARAVQHLAALNLSYTVVRAPNDGIISRRAAEVGQMVSPERPLFALVPMDDLWVVANFKEDQLRGLQLGARAEVELDAFSGGPLIGSLESISAGTGARFALLPPDNATGNFTKVAQRVPVIVRLADTRPFPLRPGLSAKVTVYAAPHK